MMTPPTPTNLEDAKHIIAELCNTIEQFTETVTNLQSQVAWMKRQMFGRKAERWNEDHQPTLFGDMDPPSQGESDDSPEEQEPAVASKSRRRGKRQPIPDDLPRVDRIHDLPDEEKAGLTLIGEEISEQIEHQPGKFFVTRHHRLKYARIDQADEPNPDTPNVILADKPVEGLPKCLAAPSLLSYLMVCKFADHLPLYRQEGIHLRGGVHIPRSSMCRWAQNLGKMCIPLLALMKSIMLESHVIQGDETPVKQQVKGRTGEAKVCYFYNYNGDDEHPFHIYDYQTGRSRAGPHSFFTDANDDAIYHGYLQCDGYTGYNDLFDIDEPWRMIHVGCWAHARRKFYDARTNFVAPCHHALARIKELYAIESEAAKAELAADQRQAMRDERSRPIVEALMKWAEKQQCEALPKSGLGEALGYLLNQKESLMRYLDDGRLAIDNNRCERGLRGIAIGRKNWMFTGSEAGGRAAAAMFSLIASAKRCGLDPQAYLTDVFTRLPATPINQLHQFLPDRWQSAAAEQPSS